jgi:hypothetical protein
MRELRHSAPLPFIDRQTVKLFVVMLALGAAACANPSEKVTNARPMTGPAASLKSGDCVQARSLLAADPTMMVDSLPKKIGGPTPFTPTPASVIEDMNKNGMKFRAEVLIDTLGRPKVESLKVIETSNEWFPRNLKALLPRMTFSPAIVVGCKVERVYKFETSLKPKA